MLPEDVSIFGLDEHTACLIDLDKEEAVIKGLGRVTLRRQGGELVFEKGDRFSLDVLRGGDGEGDWQPASGQQAVYSEPAPGSKEDSYWDRIHAIQESFRKGIEKHEPKETTNALLELDRTTWQAKQDLENEEFISQGREVLRDLIVLLGMKLEASPKDRADCLAPLVEDLLKMREEYRKNQQWQEADTIRNSLERAQIIVEDAEDGSRWRLKS